MKRFNFTVYKHMKETSRDGQNVHIILLSLKRCKPLVLYLSIFSFTLQHIQLHNSTVARPVRSCQPPRWPSIPPSKRPSIYIPTPSLPTPCKYDENTFTFFVANNNKGTFKRSIYSEYLHSNTLKI